MRQGYLFDLPEIEDTRPRWMRDLARKVRLMGEEVPPQAPPPAQSARLLIAQCGAKKLDRPAPVLDLYQGPLWQSIRAHAQNVQVAVLSAKHGLLLHDPLQVIAPYDLRLGPQRAAELAALGPSQGPQAHHKRTGALAGTRFGFGFGAVLKMARDRAQQDITAICLVGGKLYADVGRAWIAKAKSAGILSAEIDVTVIVDEIGLMRQRMNRWLGEVP